MAEIVWRWVVGATATTLFFFGLIEYFNTLPVTNGEILFLRTRNPYLVAQAVAHIFRGSATRAILSGLLAALLLGLLWMVAASFGRMATVRVMLDYSRQKRAAIVTSDGAVETGSVTARSATALPTLFRLNFLRISILVAAVFALFAAAILTRLASPTYDLRPAMTLLLFLPLVALIAWTWWALNWLLSLAAVFAVRDGKDAVGAISSAATLCRDRWGAVCAVSAWTGLAHLAAFVFATTVASLPLALAGALPGRFVALCVLLVTLVYFAVVDWLYTARLAGYVCIAEMPEELPAPILPPSWPPMSEPSATIDRDELIVSDVMLPLSTG
jgi:hypothetical protein